MATNYTPSTWAVAVLQKLGYKATPGAVKALVGWQAAEGGHWNNSAKYNPLNTTQAEPGSKTFRSVGQGAADIRIYKSWDQGIDATVATLNNGRYGGILAGLRKGDPGAVASAIDQSPWGTHGNYLYSAINGASAKVPAAPATVRATQAPTAPAAAPATTMTSSGVDNSGLRRQLVGDFLRSGGVKSAGATQTLASGWVNAQDVPAQTAQATAAPTTPTAKAPSATTGSLPSGTSTFDGKTVAAWIAPALQYARERGWKGTVNSGFRSYADQKRIYDSGVRPAAVPGTSNHEGSDFPRGAVDVSDPEQLSQILQGSPYAKRLVWAGSKDPVHFSHPHNGSY